MIRIVEVGPRDGLQNEPTPIDTSIKLEYIQNLIGAGVREIEVTSFVSPKYVPQLADSMDLWKQLPPGPLYSALVPNRRGLENAMSVGVERICLFTATSDAFTQKNINMTVDQSLAEFAEVIRDFRNHTPKSWIRLYMSTAFHCPYSGPVSAQVASEKISRAMELDVDELSIGDTTGYGIPQDVRNLDSLLNLCKEKVAWHFHDTRGMAIANVQVALDLGYEVFDASSAGLGGCPYAPGAGGNLATEDLVYLLHRQGKVPEINLELLSQASSPILAALGRSASAKAQVAQLALKR